MVVSRNYMRPGGSSQACDHPPVIALLLALQLAATCPDGDRMAYVPAGPFWMGSDRAERTLAQELSSEAVRKARWIDTELSRRRVSPAAFCIDRHLVTNDEYAAFVRTTKRRAPALTREEYQRQGFLVHEWSEWTPYLWRDGRPPAGRGDHPVVLVTAEDAAAYCQWRHRWLRLPTETEWEKAARGDDGRMFPWGAAWDATRLNSAAAGPKTTTPVGGHGTGVSPYGLFDAVGNVFQWTSTAQRDGRRVLKGCAWDDDAGLCRPAFRHARPPDSRHILIGFRCASGTTRSE